MCSSNIERERTKPYCSRCVAVADFLCSQRCCCRMWCSRLRASCRLWLTFIASLHYINSPKLAKSRQEELDESCQNNKGAEYYCLSSCRICSQSDDPLTNGIVLQITPPSPLSSREWIRRVKTAPANGTFLSTTWKIRRRNLRRGGGDGVGGGLAWLLETKKIVFWWFLQSYMTSRRSSYWFLLLIEQRIFWYWLGF
jgi:hypothetical protein